MPRESDASRRPRGGGYWREHRREYRRKYRRDYWAVAGALTARLVRRVTGACRRFCLALAIHAACACLAFGGIAVGITAAHADVPEVIRRERENSQLLGGEEAKQVLAREWIRFNAQTPARRQEALKEIRALGTRLADDQAAGRSRACSAQIFAEAKWRALYTANFTLIEQRIRDLQASFKIADQSFAEQQSAEDGSWGACFQPMFMRMEETLMSLQKMEETRVAPRYKLNIIPEINSGNDAQVLLLQLLISDIADEGIDHRSELAALVSNGAQFQFKQYWQRYLEDYVTGLLRQRDPAGIAKLRGSFRAFINAWQDQETGYWGAWYRIGGNLYRTTDLSITFHLISDLQGDVRLWPQIIETTLKIADDPYPYGWRYGRSSNNHNNYDVVKIFRYGWPHMTEDQRARASKAMRAMLDWALTQSLQPDGSFAPDPKFSDSLAADYYFGISFFDEIGYWRPKKRFWTTDTFAGSQESCQRVRQRFTSLALKSPTAAAAQEKLDNSCREP